MSVGFWLVFALSHASFLWGAVAFSSVSALGRFEVWLFVVHVRELGRVLTEPVEDKEWKRLVA